MEKSPNKFLNITEAINFLYSLEFHGIKLGLENTEAFFKHVNLDMPAKIIHVAGTNGKGSTCQFLKSCLIEHDFSVGVFTSPHILKFNERIKYNDEHISDNDIQLFLEEYADYIWQKKLTFFEVNTILALHFFNQKKPDFVILETGMGGRLDSTNICNPMVTVITNVSLDHTEFLGSDVLSIAKEKAGIIKENIPLFTAEEKKDVLNLFQTVCEGKRAPLFNISTIQKVDTSSFIYKNFVLKTQLIGDHQFKNFALAYDVTEFLLSDKFDRDLCNSASSKMTWPARLEEWQLNKNIILDVSHNLEGIKFSIFSLKEKYVNKKFLIICSFLDDKNWSEIIKTLRTLSNKILIYPLKNKRQNYKNLLERAKKEKLKIFDNNEDITGLEKKYHVEKVLFIGSHYLIEEFLNNNK